MTTLFQVMLYVENQEQVANFWCTHFNYTQVQSFQVGSTTSFVLASDINSSQLVIHNKTQIAQLQPELTLTIPSLLFGTTQDLREYHQRLKAKGVNVGDLVPLGDHLTFNFADPEGNYFAMIQR